MTARQVLARVLCNGGAEVAAHEVIRRHHHEAEGIERLSAEYLTLATLAQADRWDALLAHSGLTDPTQSRPGRRGAWPAAGLVA